MSRLPLAFGDVGTVPYPRLLEKLKLSPLLVDPVPVLSEGQDRVVNLQFGC